MMYVAAMDLEALLRAARDGEPGAWKALTPHLYRVLRSFFARDFDEAETIELSQRTVEAVVRQLPGFVPRESLEQWMFGIARNQGLNEHRARSKRAGLEVGPQIARRTPTSVTARIYIGELLAILLEELEHLPLQQRRVVENEMGGGDIESFAERENILPGTARTRRYRAFERLRQQVSIRLAPRPASRRRDAATPSSPS